MHNANFLDAYKDKPASELTIAGIMGAVQALTLAFADTPEKKRHLLAIIESLSEVAFDSRLSQEQKAAYLEGISIVPLALKNPD